MPRPKKASKRGSLHGVSRGGRRPIDTPFVAFQGTSTPQKNHGLTLQEEARNTGRHQSFWSTDQRLRDSKVSFVSAGKFESTKPDEAEAALADMTLESPKQSDEEEGVVEKEVNQPEAMQEDAVESFVKTTVDVEVLNFIIDTHGSEPVQTGIPAPMVRSVSPTPSDSSEEVILFRGRDQQGRGLSRPPQASKMSTDPIEEKIRIVEDKIHEKTELLAEVLRHDETSHSSVPQPPTEGHNADFESILPQRSTRRTRTRRARSSKKSAEKEEEDALIADYIANINEDDVAFKSFNQRELGGMEEEIWQDTEASSGDPVAESSRTFHDKWNRSDIEDFDDLSTSDGVMGEVQALLSKRERSSGTQYLVVWEHQSADEARWVPATTLTSVPAMIHIESFEAEEKLVAEFRNNEEDTSDSDDVEIEVEEDDEDEDDDQDLIQRKIDRMSDERMMRLLSKQEQLGLGSDEILLFDADEEDDVDADEVIAFSKSTFRSAITKSKQAKITRGPSRARGDFPSATLLADAYDGFDVMDFDRPSLQKKPKGRKGKLIVDVSDSEFEASMQMAWTNDRLKKKERKQEREELRAQGLLGNKNGKIDIKEKYKEGMGIHAVKEEIKAFLMGNNTTLSLPPMDKADRKIVHELANAFNLKSKSAGNGNNRFPILYRTSRTRAFNNGAFDAVNARISRAFFPRMDVGGRKGAGGKRAGAGGGFNKAAVMYRDGDVVGGSAPELGAENRGRAMLEKMGWSSGTALGALNNKGILQPVSHVVKQGKAGLG